MSDAKLFDDRDPLANAAALIEIRAATPARQRRMDVAEAQEKRAQLLMRAGYTVRVGPNGSTVFKGPDLEHVQKRYV